MGIQLCLFIGIFLVIFLMRWSVRRRIFYDGLPLSVRPTTLVGGQPKVDCKVTKMSCLVDSDCWDLCESIVGNFVCQGYCDYLDEATYCLNGGKFAWHDYGRTRLCTCPDEFYGPRCELTNPFIRKYHLPLKMTTKKKLSWEEKKRIWEEKKRYWEKKLGEERS